jgi:hypothetical protein
MPGKASKIINKKILFRFLIAFIITGFFIFTLFKNLNIQDFKQYIKNADLFLLFAAFIVYIVINLIRSLRVLILSAIRFREFDNLFFINARHYFFNKILPAKLGELSLVYFLKKEQDIAYTRGLGLLFYLRIIDILFIPLFFTSALFLNYSKSISGLNYFTLIIIAILVFILIVLILFFINKILYFTLKFFKFLPVKIKWLNKKFYYYFLEKTQKFNDVVKDFAVIKTNTKIIFLSLINRFFILTLFYLVFISFGISMSFIVFIIVSTLSFITEAIPINGFGSFGTFEAGWTIGFIIFGYSNKISLISGFITNVVIFIFTIILLILAFFSSRRGLLSLKSFFKFIIICLLKKNTGYGKL